MLFHYRIIKVRHKLQKKVLDNGKNTVKMSKIKYFFISIFLFIFIFNVLLVLIKN